MLSRLAVSRRLLLRVLAGAVLAASQVGAAVGTEIGFVVIKAHAPLRVGPPDDLNGSERLGVRIRGLNDGGEGEIVITVLEDADQDGVVDAPRGQEVRRRSLQDLATDNLTTQPGELVAAVSWPHRRNFNQLELVLHGPQGAVIAGPVYLTLEPESLYAHIEPALAGFGDAAWRVLRRLVRIADVVRNGSGARAIFVVETDANGAPVPIEVVPGDPTPRALALAPAGDAVAWVGREHSMDIVQIARLGVNVESLRLLESSAPLAGPAFLDPHTIVLARDGEILLGSDDPAQASRVVTTGFKRILSIYHAQRAGAQDQVLLRAAMPGDADSGPGRVYRVDIGPDAGVTTRRLFELPVYGLLSKRTASGRVCFAIGNGDAATVSCIAPSLSQPEVIAHCTKASLVSAAAASERLAFVAESCR